jgi:Cyclin, N-terminal domain
MAARPSWREVDAVTEMRRAAGTQSRADILASLSAGERNGALWPAPDYLATVYGGAAGIGSTTRAALARWVFSEAADAGILCHAATAALAVNYLDRVLASTPVRRGALQDVAAACLQLAVKMAHGEQGPVVPALPEFELAVLRALRWRLVVPTPMTFLNVYARRFWLPDAIVSRAQDVLKLYINRMFPSFTIPFEGVAKDVKSLVDS